MDKKKSSTVASSSPERSGKGSKATRKARLREEEERRLQEEARLKAEQEEKERLEREKKLAEEKRVREQRIAELKNNELNSFYDLVNDLNSKLDHYHKDERVRFKWARYMKCDGSPDPSISGEINTFLTLWHEDQENNDVPSSLNQIGLALKLIDETNFLIEDCEDKSSPVIPQYQQTIKNLEKAILVKLNLAAHNLLLGASENIDPETLNFDFSGGNEDVFYCVWANLSHNTRIKDISFPKKNFNFVLPRPLTLANISVHSLFTSFDLFSSNSRSYSCKVPVPVFDFDPIPDLKPKEPEIAPEEPSNTDDDDLPPELKAIMQKNVSMLKDDSTETKPVDEVKDEAKEPVQVEVQVETKPVLSEEQSVLIELADPFVIDLRNYTPLGPIIHFGLFDLPPQPKKIKQWVILERDSNGMLKSYKYPPNDQLSKMAWDEYWSRKQDEQTAEAEKDEAGDTIKSKKSDLNLTMKSNDFLESTIGADETIASDSNKQFLKTILNKNNEELVKLMKVDGPIQISYKVPTSVFFAENPTLARWDQSKSHWRTDEILDYKYNQETKEINFKTYHFGPYCLLQDRYVLMPFQSWRLAPRENINNCMLTIEFANFEFTIEILLDKLRIYVPIRKPIVEDPATKNKKLSLNTTTKQKQLELERQQALQRLDYESHNPNPNLQKVIEPFANKWFELREFKKVLRSLGLNIFPDPDSERFVSITNKNKKLEWLVYQNMALCSCLLAFSFSKWHTEINDDAKAVLQYQVHTTDKEPSSSNYKCMICTNDVFYLTESLDTSTEFSQACAPGTEEHADMYHLCTDEIIRLQSVDKSLIDSRIRVIDPLYYGTVKSTLEAIKFLTHC